MPRAPLALSLLLLFLTGPATFAAPGEFVCHSGVDQVALVELYSSEGCSSCPPAERWLGDLRRDPGLWRDFVPIAFNVNYWDRLGWRDVFATREFTQREYRYAEAWHAPSVYTPCFVRNGTEWHPRGDPAADAARPPVGELTVTRTAAGECRIRFTPAAGSPALPGELDVSLALLAGGIVSPVRAGENAGRDLRHEFVALALTTAPLTPGADGTWAATVVLVRPHERTFPTIARLALAAWITPHGQLVPLQATGGWLDSHED